MFFSRAAGTLLPAGARYSAAVGFAKAAFGSPSVWLPAWCDMLTALQWAWYSGRDGFVRPFMHNALDPDMMEQALARLRRCPRRCNRSVRAGGKQSGAR